jgi:gluconolactonase
VWFPPTDDFFFVQNAGAKEAGTGLAKSAVVQKVSLGQVGRAIGALRAQGGGGVGRRSVAGSVDVVVVNSTVQVVNPNGACVEVGARIEMESGRRTCVREG